MFAILEDPLLLATAFVVITLVCLLLGKKHAESMWGTAGAIYGGYILTSSLSVFLADDVWQCVVISLGCSVLYLILIGCFVQAGIGLFKLQGSSQGAMVFVVIMYHPIVLLAAAGIQWAYSAIAGSAQ
tara:strand:- start:4004 stop:4387 length:384 start_codon:yes stop_codon:yes gene_type:complete